MKKLILSTFILPLIAACVCAAQSPTTPTPSLGLQLIPAGTLQWNVPVNANTSALDSILGGCFALTQPSPGTICYFNGSAWVRLPGNTSGTQFLQETSAGVPSWAASTASINWGQIGGTLSAQADLQSALNLKAPLISPAFTGTPTAATASPGTNTTQLATTAFVLANAASAPVTSVFGRTGVIAAQNGDYSVGQVTGAAPLASPTFSGAVTMPTATLSAITGAAQCLHVNNSGVISGTGADCSVGGGGAFSTLSGGTNTTASMVVGSGATLAATGTGVIAATTAPFAGLVTGSNTTASMLIGSGATLGPTGTGVVTANAVAGNAIPTGTTNQIAVAASSPPVISVSSTFVFPGTVALSSSTRGAPLVAGATNLISTSAQTVDASQFAGADWGAKVVAAATSISNVGTVLIPPSLASIAAYVSFTVPSGITLQFTGGGDFGACTITLGTFTKIFNPGASRIVMDATGSGCFGWNYAGTEPVLTSNDTPILDGVRVNCNGQAASRGIFLSSGNNALFKIQNPSVSGCQDAGFYTQGFQFSMVYNANFSANAVGIKDYSTGGSSSLTFVKPNLTAETSGVGAIFWNTSTSQTMNGNHIIDPICNTDTIVCIAIIGVTGNGYTWNRFYIDGGTPEQNGGGGASVTIDGNVINNCGFISLNQAGAVLTNLEIHEAVAQTNGCLTNNSAITFVGTSGGGVKFTADSTSFVNFVGPLNNDATIQNVNTWPTSVGGANFIQLYGSPQGSNLNANTPNDFTGNSLFLPVATSNAASTGSAIDPVFGKVLSVVFNASVGNKGTNRVIPVTVATPAFNYDEIISVYLKSSVDANISIGDNNSNFAFTRLTPAVGSQWYRGVMYARNVASGLAIQPDFFAADAAGATVEFYGLEVAYGPTGTAATQARIDQVLNGGINPNGYSSRFVPTIASGFGTTPTVPSGKTTTAFTVNVGTGGSATSGVLTMPAATAGWTCQVNDLTAAAAHVAYNTRQTASTTTTVTVENQTTSTGAAVAWAASDILNLSCDPY